MFKCLLHSLFLNFTTRKIIEQKIHSVQIDIKYRLDNLNGVAKLLNY